MERLSQRRLSVAAMPRARPLPDTKYLSIIDKRPLPVSFINCYGCPDLDPPSKPRLHRHMASLVHTCMAIQPGIRLSKETHIYYDEDRDGLVYRIAIGVGPGEIARPVRGQHDWSRYYAWALAMQHRDPAGRWAVEGRFFFHNIVWVLQYSVPWQDKSWTLRHKSDKDTVYHLVQNDLGGAKYQVSSCYSGYMTDPYWCAAKILRHESMESLLAADDTDTWDYFTPQTCSRYGLAPYLHGEYSMANFHTSRAELNQSTGPGRYKKVMWYNRGIG